MRETRPLGVGGYREFSITMLPACDSEPQRNVRRSSSAPNCSSFVNWTSTDDLMVWMLDVHTTGGYKAVTCPETDAGSLVELSLRDNRVAGRVNPGWNSPL